jgi:hypothetical protein
MVAEFWKPCGSKLTVVSHLTGDPLFGKQTWVGPQVPTGCRRKHNKSKHKKQVASAGIRASKVYELGTTRFRVTTA